MEPQHEHSIGPDNYRKFMESLSDFSKKENQATSLYLAAKKWISEGNSLADIARADAFNFVRPPARDQIWETMTYGCLPLLPVYFYHCKANANLNEEEQDKCNFYNAVISDCYTSVLCPKQKQTEIDCFDKGFQTLLNEMVQLSEEEFKKKPDHYWESLAKKYQDCNKERENLRTCAIESWNFLYPEQARIKHLTLANATLECSTPALALNSCIRGGGTCTSQREQLLACTAHSLNFSSADALSKCLQSGSNNCTSEYKAARDALSEYQEEFLQSLQLNTKDEDRRRHLLDHINLILDTLN